MDGCHVRSGWCILWVMCMWTRVFDGKERGEWGGAHKNRRACSSEWREGVGQRGTFSSSPSGSSMLGAWRVRLRKTAQIVSDTRLRLDVTVLTLSSSEHVTNSAACAALTRAHQMPSLLGGHSGRSALGAAWFGEWPITASSCGAGKSGGKVPHKGDDEVEVIPGLFARVLRMPKGAGGRQAACKRGAGGASAEGLRFPSLFFAAVV